MNMKRIALLLFSAAFLLLATGCGNDKTKADLRNSAAGQPNQEMSIKVKKKLASYKEISTVHAINNKERIFVAFDVTHRNSLKIESIEEKARKDLKKMFPKKEIEISTDGKLVTEVEQVENRLHKRSDKLKIDEEIDRLTKLSRKKT